MASNLPSLLPSRRGLRPFVLPAPGPVAAELLRFLSRTPALALAATLVLAPAAVAQCGTGPVGATALGPLPAAGPNVEPITMSDFFPPDEEPEIGICVCYQMSLEDLRVSAEGAIACQNGGATCAKVPQCTTGCVGPLPLVDSDNDGQFWPVDSDEPYPFDAPPDHPLIDRDGNEVPDALDLFEWDEFEGWTKRLNPNGLLPSGLTDFDLAGALALRGATAPVTVPSVGGAQLVDTNGDGLLTLGEAVSQAFTNAYTAAAAAHDRHRGKPQILGPELQEWQQDMEEARQRLAAVWPGFAATFTELAGGALGEQITGLLQSLEQSVHAIRFDNGTIVVVVDGGAAGPLVARFVPHPDGTLSRKVTWIDGTGQHVSPESFPPDSSAAMVARGLDSVMGDPVDTASGEFVYTAVDLHLRGRGLDLKLERHYRSRALRVASFGRNWQMPLVDTFAIFWPGMETVEVDWGDGTVTQYVFDAAAQEYRSTPGDFSKLRIASDLDRATDPNGLPGAVVRRPDGKMYYFCAPTWFAGAGDFMYGYLRRVADLHGNSIEFTRDDLGRALTIKDTLGRITTLGYHAESGFVSHITDAEGRRVDYEYDAARGELRQVRWPEIPVLKEHDQLVSARPGETYIYAEHPSGWLINKCSAANHNLIQVIPTGQVSPAIEVFYEVEPGQNFDRVTHYVVDGQVTAFRYHAAGPGTLLGADPIQPEARWVTEVVESDGSMTRYIHADGLLLRKETVNRRFTSSFVDLGVAYTPPPPALTPGKWIKQFEYDSEFRLTAEREYSDVQPAVFRETRSVYDATSYDRGQQGNPIEITETTGPNALSRSTQIVYDPVSNEAVSITNPMGEISVRRFAHHEHPWGDVATWPTIAGWGILSATTPAHAIAHFGRGDINGDGLIVGQFGAVSFEQNCELLGPAPTLSPPVGQSLAESVRYNSFGQPTRHTDASGAVTRITYSDGFPDSMTEGLGQINRVTQFVFDGLGRIRNKLSADRNLTLTSYNAMDLPVEMRLRASAVPRDVIQAVGDGSTGVNPLPEDERDILVQAFYNERGLLCAVTQRHHSAGFVLPINAGPQSPIAIRYVYSPSGRLVETERTTYSTGQTTTARWRYEYDSRGQLRRVEHPDGSEEQFSHDPRGLRTAHVRKAQANATVVVEDKWDFDNLGRSVLHSDPSGRSTAWTYDDFGRAVTSRTATGLVTSRDYDLLDRVTTERVERDGKTLARTDYKRDQLGRAYEITEHVFELAADGSVAIGSPPTVQSRTGFGPLEDQALWSWEDTSTPAGVVTYDHDALGRRTGTWSGTSQEFGEQLTLHKSGRLLARRVQFDSQNRPGPESPSSATWTFDYDRHGRLKGVVQPNGGQQLLSWNALGKKVNHTDALGRRTNYTYDSFGDQICRTTIDSSGNVISTERVARDSVGRVVAIEDSIGGVASFVYDSLSQVVQSTDANGRVVSHTYDAAGRPLMSSSQGHVVLRSYDSGGRLVTVSATGSGASVVRTIGYDALDRVAHVVESVGTSNSTECRFLYDSRGRTRQDSSAVAGQWKVTSASWSSNDRIQDLTWNSGHRVTYTRDAFGRIDALTSSLIGPIVAYGEHYGSDRARRATRPNGALSSREYNSLGLLMRRSLTDLPASADDESVVISYDPSGGLTARTYHPSLRSELFQYDGGDRIRRWEVDLDADGTVDRSRDWEWNSRTNWTSITDQGSSSPSLTGSYDGMNQVMSAQPVWGTFTYDQGGAETSRSGGGLTLSTEWDSLGRMLRSEEVLNGVETTVNWTYDGLDRLVQRSDSVRGTTRYVWFEGQVIEADTTGGQRLEYARGIDGSVVWARSSSGQSLWVEVDELGSPVRFDSPTGLVERCAYEPFGRVLDAASYQPLAASAAGIELFYMGLPQSLASGRVSTGPRMLDPEVARFLSRDPAGVAAGANLYAYAHGNPLRLADSTGYAPSTAQIEPGIDMVGVSALPHNPSTEDHVSADDAFYVADRMTEDNTNWFEDFVRETHPGDRSTGYSLGTTSMRDVDTREKYLRAAYLLEYDWDASGLSASDAEKLEAMHKWVKESAATYQVLSWIERADYGLSVPEALLGKGISELTGVSYDDARSGVDTALFLWSGVKSAAKHGVRGVSSLASQVHHLATNKNVVSAARGGPWTPRFEALFQKAGMSLNDALNKVTLPGHKGPHSEEYHKAVFTRLQDAVSGLSGKAYRDSFRRELEAIGRDVLDSTSTLHRLATGG